ncbi:MAG: DUF4037 domain-containing protein [Bacteroidetes bacterium]|nr:DUF4037 domain-containing protein [Bacteroidota bacterium]
MMGIQVSERYYHFYGRKMIAEKFPDYESRIAVGLVGEGSDCFGYDDEISRDHDWGPAFCMWLNKNDFDEIGVLLQKEYEKLPGEFAGIKPRVISKHGIGRTGVIEISSFYENFTGLSETPASLMEWLSIPETNLAACTNGKIFFDDFGEFSFYRNKLLEFYPEDVRLKKIASRCVVLGREGQYNILRCLRRKDLVAANYALAIFIEASISLVFLLNYKYMPFYKWMHKALINLPILGSKAYDLIQQLVVLNNTGNMEKDYTSKEDLINLICCYLVDELNKQQLSDVKSKYLLDHVEVILNKISDDEIKNYKM